MEGGGGGDGGVVGVKREGVPGAWKAGETLREGVLGQDYVLQMLWQASYRLHTYSECDVRLPGG